MTLRSRAHRVRADPRRSAVSPVAAPLPRRGRAERRAPSVPRDQQDRGHPGPRERRGQRLDPRAVGRHLLEDRAGDDGEVARLEGVEARDPGLEHPHPADLAGGPLRR